MMHSSASNLKIQLYKLMIGVRIPVDMDFFLLYMVYHSRDTSNINLPAALYDTNSVDRVTKI